MVAFREPCLCKEPLIVKKQNGKLLFGFSLDKLDEEYGRRIQEETHFQLSTLCPTRKEARYSVEDATRYSVREAHTSRPLIHRFGFVLITVL